MDATNDFSKLVHGEELQDKPYYKAVRFASKYQPKNRWGDIGPKPWEEYKNRLAESSRQSAVFKVQVERELDEEKFKDPYGVEFKKLLYDMYANDYIAATAVDIINWAAFSTEIAPVVMPVGNQVYESEDALQKALDDTDVDEEKRKGLIDYVESVDRLTGMRYYKQDASKQAMVGGRSALFLETFEGKNDLEFPVGTPAIIKPLHWSYLNQVRVDTTSWKFKEVRYTDFETQANPNVFLPANKLIYITRNDSHITPSLFYGLSDFHSIWKISNIIRQCEEVDIPEIVTSMWAQAGFFKFSNMNTNEMDAFMDSLGPGLYRGFNNRVEYVPVPLKHDGWFIITLLQNMISHMLMKLRVPEFLFSFDKATSRSSVEIQMNVFRDVAVEGTRQWMDRFLDEQWYQHLVGLYLNQPDPRKHKIRIVRQYKPLTFEDILAKANSLELLARRYFLDRFEGRQMLGLPPHNKNLDANVNPIGQLLDLSPVEKLQQEHADKLAKEQQKQTTMDQFGGGQKQKPPVGQKGFTNTAPIRSNSAPIGTAGAGRGNKT